MDNSIFKINFGKLIMVKNIKLKTHIDSLLIVEKYIDQMKDEGVINEDCYGNVMVCATEAVNNSIHHGNKEDINKSIDLQIEYDDKTLTFDIKDEGPGFDYKNIPDPTLPENIEKLSGRGVFLIKNLADEVEFIGNGSEIKFSFKL